jgi:DNA-binding response OmpR family regulator
VNALHERILVVDDEQGIQGFIETNLVRAGFEVIQALDGQTALQKVADNNIDCILLDLGLPDSDGFDICREVRKNHTTPIIILTARGDDIDKILGLELGADDYIVKPFNPRELVARIKAVLRRVSTPPPADAEPQNQRHIKLFDLTIDLDRHEVRRGTRQIDLTPKEYDLLSFLAEHPGYAFSREKLLQEVWGYDFFGDDRTVDVHIRRLREKLEDDPNTPFFILTVWGVGYKFREQNP